MSSFDIFDNVMSESMRKESGLPFPSPKRPKCLWTQLDRPTTNQSNETLHLIKNCLHFKMDIQTPILGALVIENNKIFAYTINQYNSQSQSVMLLESISMVLEQINSPQWQ